MLDNDIIMDIPAGVKAFDKDGNQNELTESKPIKLGTDWGNATFRVFMETKVIPDLKRGIIKPGVELGAIKANKFIKDLTPDLFTKTVSSNPTILYTLPINMLPRTDIEQALLDSYIAEFNNLAAYNNYTYEIIKRDSNGNEQLIQRSIPIKDLFVYYSMIAHNWKLGENSLVPILESFQNEGVIDSFHKYEAALDNSDDVPTNYDIREVLPYVAPRMSPYSAYTEYIKSKNPTNQKIEIMKKLSGKDIASADEALDVEWLDEKPNLTGYEFISSDLDTNYFTTGVIASTNRQLTTDFIDNNGNKAKLDIIYDAETNAIDRIAINDTTYKIENLQELLVRKVDGRKVPRLEEMKSIIKNELYPCHA